MTDQRYNGWANYETWCVKLWMDNDEGSCDYWNERAEHWAGEESTSEHWSCDESAKFNLADELKDSYEERRTDLVGLEGTVFSDMLGAAFSEVDWQEIAENLLSEFAETPR